jgi:hypothetical protein
MSFPKQIAVAFVSLCALGAYPLMKFGSAPAMLAAICGGIVMTGNVLLGYAAVQYSIGKSTATFMKVVLGGMGVRMLALLLITALLIKGCGLDAAAIVYLVLELIFIQQKISVRQQN